MSKSPLTNTKRLFDKDTNAIGKKAAKCKTDTPKMSVYRQNVRANSYASAKLLFVQEGYGSLLTKEQSDEILALLKKSKSDFPMMPDFDKSKTLTEISDARMSISKTKKQKKNE